VLTPSNFAPNAKAMFAWITLSASSAMRGGLTPSESATRPHYRLSQLEASHRNAHGVIEETFDAH
jgi:hypothetical protein